MAAGVLDAQDLRQRVDKALAAFCAGQAPALEDVSEELGAVGDTVTEFLLGGGKRLRPAFCYWGWRGAGGEDNDEIVVASAALELLHGCALIHDDVMDSSERRRGRPAVHRRFASVHRFEGWHGSPEEFGAAAAILLGDLCLVWSGQMLDGSGLSEPALRAARPVFDRMRVELMGGQYLDLLERALGPASTLERALRVARYKSAKYTVEKPLHLGAVLAGGPPELTALYSAYGLPLGEAFQLRDDVLGVFGDPARTGKPAGEDLREGKRTALVAAALGRASPTQSAVVRRFLGDPHLGPEGIEALRAVFTDTGALAEVESLIEAKTGQALRALQASRIDREAADALRQLAVAATHRAV